MITKKLIGVLSVFTGTVVMFVGALLLNPIVVAAGFLVVLLGAAKMVK